jgi:septal ring factor EnvC (AmiA/AmiB activator)
MKHSFLLLILLSSPLVVSQDSLQSALSKESNSSSQASNRQESINLLDINLITLKGDIQFLNQELDITNVYNEQLQRLIDSQNNEINSLNQQIVDLDETNKRIMPLLLDMVKTLDKLLDFDYPFLLTERKDRVNNLYSLLDRSDISTSEKFRRVFEAYQIENEFGRTIEALILNIKLIEDLKLIFGEDQRVLLIQELMDLVSMVNLDRVNLQIMEFNYKQSKN